MQVIGRNGSTKPFKMRWERVDVEVCSLKAGTGNLIKSLEPQWHTKLETCREQVTVTLETTTADVNQPGSRDFGASSAACLVENI